MEESASMSTAPTDVHKASQLEVTSSNRFELRLVYRTLRLISDWTLQHFYSEVYIEGAENVEEHGALILTPCHHNEIIDIATLSATVPHKRFVSYWTKASLFNNPVTRFILTSAGSIPVARAPNEGRKHTLTRGDRDKPRAVSGGEVQEALFNATYEELARGGALGVFPEGTSYTMPRIIQVKEGAARAALGFARRFPDKNLSLVPVGITYTDKSKYRSRVIVRYGERIPLQPFTSRCSSSVPGSAEERDAVQGLTSEIERRLIRLTINARTWDVLYAARTARDILWAGDDIPLLLFVGFTQALIDIFEEVHPGELLQILLRYHALQFHTGIAHTHISHIPSPPLKSKKDSEQNVLTDSIARLMAQSFGLGIPLLISLPVHITQLDAYIFGTIAASRLAGKEEEAVAQYKTIIGGFGRAIGALVAGGLCWKAFKACFLGRANSSASIARSSVWFKVVYDRFTSFLPGDLQTHLCKWTDVCASSLRAINSAHHDLSLGGYSVNIAGTVIFACLIVALHGRIIDGDNERFKRLRATLLVLKSRLTTKPKSVTDEDLKSYYSYPPPPVNRYIKATVVKDVLLSDAALQDNSDIGAKDGEASCSTTARYKRIPKSILMDSLLRTREEATMALGKFLQQVDTFNAPREKSKRLEEALKLVKEHNILYAR